MINIECSSIIYKNPYNEVELYENVDNIFANYMELIKNNILWHFFNNY